jgi:tetratricopeptide (TPR) repeat protein
LIIFSVCVNVSNGQGQIDSGAACYKRGEYKKALEYFNQVNETDTNCEVLGYKADSYRHIGNYDLAIRFFEQATKDCEPNYEMYLNLGDSYFKKGLINEAYRNFLKTYSMNHDNFEVNYNLGLISYQYGNFTEAKVYARKATKLKPKEIDAFDLLSEIHNSLEEYDSSLQIIDKLHKEKPSNRTLLLKAYVYGDKGDYEKCIELTTDVLKSDPTNVNAYHNRYLAYYKLNNKKKGCRDYKKVKMLDKESEIENYFGCK